MDYNLSNMISELRELFYDKNEILESLIPYLRLSSLMLGPLLEAPPLLLVMSTTVCDAMREYSSCLAWVQFSSVGVIIYNQIEVSIM